MAKRLFDFVISLIGLVVLAPLLLVISVAVLLDSGFPVLFRQERVGQHGNRFSMIKFRTMRQGSESRSRLTVFRDPRVTRTGAWLRRYKLDELPQLINVLRGSMSLVGPRPEVPEYVATYSEEDRKIVLSAKPGITDNAAIEFRNENELLRASEDPDLTYRTEILPRKLAIYKEYVRNSSVCGDIALIFRTLKALMGRQRSSAAS